MTVTLVCRRDPAAGRGAGPWEPKRRRQQALCPPAALGQAMGSETGMSPSSAAGTRWATEAPSPGNPTRDDIGGVSGRRPSSGRELRPQEPGIVRAGGEGTEAMRREEQENPMNSTADCCRAPTTGEGILPREPKKSQRAAVCPPAAVGQARTSEPRNSGPICRLLLTSDLSIQVDRRKSPERPELQRRRSSQRELWSYQARDDRRPHGNHAAQRSRPRRSRTRSNSPALPRPEALRGGLAWASVNPVTAPSSSSTNSGTSPGPRGCDSRQQEPRNKSPRTRTRVAMGGPTTSNGNSKAAAGTGSQPNNHQRVRPGSNPGTVRRRHNPRPSPTR